MCMGGVFQGPGTAKAGSSCHGFTVDDRVEVVDDSTNGFKGWIGKVINFDSKLVAVDLNEPPKGCSRNGQWFLPLELELRPIQV